MHLPVVNYVAVITAAVVLFLLGGLWYSRALFAKRWIALQGKSEEELKANAGPPAAMLVAAFICALLIAWTMAVILNHFRPLTTLRGLAVGVGCWLGFAASTSFSTAIFSGKPRALWMIDTGYNLVSFALAGAIIGWWPWV